MYPDPKRVRDNRVTIRFDDYEDELLRAMANFKGEQMTTMLREMAMTEARRVLGLDAGQEDAQA
ncbi:MAG: hypothetical protein KBC94_07805 [Pseudacidovorax sp.]|uniref:hypothetical protein n=1 Tax=Pseudacidovorax sp. TaxID=1934311 RepID=UPI001B628652|nr:hypothetical protein [Pseudacidovorax sp.]MBP6894312.1 hypothetical protein [Pseudacidovorax sp.]